MKPEILQNISQIILLIGGIFTCLGTYGHFHFGKKIDNNKEVSITSKLDSIPQSMDRILDAVDRIEVNIEKISESDGSNIKTINYPQIGVFGTNILDKNVNNYSIGTHSMRVEIPKEQSIIVKISGKNWSFPAFQSIPGWKHYDYEAIEGKTIRKFKTVKAGIIDLEINLTDQDEIELLIFENGADIPSWKKILLVKTSDHSN